MILASKSCRDFCNLIFAGRDAIRDAQKEEIEITKENVLYEVPTSVIKVAEVDTQKKKTNIKMKENQTSFPNDDDRMSSI